MVNFSTFLPTSALAETVELHKKRVAIVHDQLYTYGGAERVLAEMITCFPNADLFALFDIMPPAERGFLQGRPVTTTFLQRMPRLRRWHRHYFALMPLAIEQLDLRRYDLIISSSYLVAKGIVASPDQLHISYVHSPMRYAWDLQHQYLQQMNLERGVLGWPLRWLLHYMRLWDSRTAAGVDAFVVNSAYIARRLTKVHNRGAEVIHPPVALDRFSCTRSLPRRDPFFVTVSRQVPYKRIDLIVEAFAQLPDERLVVIGDGPEAARLRGLAGANVTFLGAMPDEIVVDHIRRARAFVYAAEEDFGIAPVEAQACGTPVIAYGRGGILETVRGLQHAAPTGVFFPEQTPQALRHAIQAFNAQRARFDAEDCVRNAKRFSAERFRAEFTAFVEHHAAEMLGARQDAPALPVARLEVDRYRKQASLTVPSE